MRATRRTAVALTVASALVSAALASASPAAATACPVVTATGAVMPQITGQVFLSGCDLRGADLRGLDLSGSSISTSDLTGADLRGARLFNTWIKGGVLDGADFSGADLTRARLSGPMSGARFGDASMPVGELSGDITGAELGGADLRGMLAGPVSGTPASLPSGWSIRGGRLVGPGVDLRNGLYGVDLSGADLTDAVATGSYLTGWVLHGAVLTRLDVRGADVRGADLTGAVGSADMYADRETLWGNAICADGRLATTHDEGSCAEPYDSTPPVVSLGAMPTLVWRNGMRPYAPVSITEAGSGVMTYKVRQRLTRAASGSTGTWVTYENWGVPDPRLYASLSSDQRWCGQVKAQDWAGNWSAWSNMRCVDAATDVGFVTWQDLRGGWDFSDSSSFWNYEALRTYYNGAGLRSQKSFVVKRVGLVATTCSSCGSVAVYVGSTKVGSVSLTSTTRQTVALRMLPTLSSTLTGNIRLVVTSPAGRLVRVDAVMVTAS